MDTCSHPDMSIAITLDGEPSSITCPACGWTWQVTDGEPPDENMSYLPGNPDYERDLERDRERDV